jgi:hypothetical protein
MEQPGSCHFFDDGKMQDANPYTPKNGVLVPQQATFTYAETFKLVETAVAFHEGATACAAQVTRLPQRRPLEFRRGMSLYCFVNSVHVAEAKCGEHVEHHVE